MSAKTPRPHYIRYGAQRATVRHLAEQHHIPPNVTYKRYTLHTSFDTMHPRTVEIEVYDKREKLTMTIHVVQISDNVFRIIENELFNDSLTLGTEFETRQDQDGIHEIVRILKKSEFITRRFSLTSHFKESEYRLLGDEIMKQGGFWQVDFGSIVTINLPKNCKLDLDEIFKIFGLNPTEIKV